MRISEKERVSKLALEPISIDWEMNMANSIAGQILNNDECKNNYVRILAIATLKINDALRYEHE